MPQSKHIPSLLYRYTLRANTSPVIFATHSTPSVSPHPIQPVMAIAESAVREAPGQNSTASSSRVQVKHGTHVCHHLASRRLRGITAADEHFPTPRSLRQRKHHRLRQSGPVTAASVTGKLHERITALPLPVDALSARLCHTAAQASVPIRSETGRGHVFYAVDGRGALRV